MENTDFNSRFIAARKAYIEKHFMKLNPMQREAVLATEGPLLILAGAGSGKTTVLINRIYNLIKFGRGSDSDELPAGADEVMLNALLKDEDADEYAALYPVEPWRILAITFTNKAADELKSRLEARLGEQAADIWASTFHSSCVRILRRDAEKLGYAPDFSIYDTSDSLSLIRHILKDLDLDEKFYPPKAVLAEISRAKTAMLLPGEYTKTAEKTVDLYKKKIAVIYTEYMRRLFSSSCMDFDDLLLNTVLLLERNEDVLSYWQRRFKYVLIDEYQDTNMLQYRFSSMLAGGSNNICVVGDDDQSIYKFRGATIENILSFESQYKGCRTIRLEQNYRSTGHILSAANAVIRNNIERKGKELWTAKSDGDPLELYVADNENDEGQYVVSQILAGYSRGERLRDYAVLYRNNAQSNSVESALKRHGIPYRVFGGMKFYDRAEVKDILAYMCVVHSPDDSLRLERIINTPARGIGAKSIETAQEIAAREGKSLFSIISEADLHEELSRPALRMKEFAAMIKSLRDFAENNPSDALFDEIIEKTGYVRALEAKNTPEDTSKAENVMELKSGILGYINETGDTSLAGYLDTVSLYSDLDNYDAEADGVTLMTMHSSKGLEFPHVFIVGMEDTIFPSQHSFGDSSEMEEERRLCYVAITRAMKSLNLVCARQRTLYGRTNSNRVSRFVDEIPEEDIHKNIPRGYGYRDSCSAPYRTRSDSFYGGEYNSSYTHSRSVKSTGLNPASAVKPGANVRQTSQQEKSFTLGCSVLHKAFGEGVVIKMTPMGGDYLMEINFEKVGSKKLMMKAASRFMDIKE